METVKSTATMKPRDLHRQGDQYNSIYICASSYECARLAAGSAFNAVQAVLSGEVSSTRSFPGQGTLQGAVVGRPGGMENQRETYFCQFKMD